MKFILPTFIFKIERWKWNKEYRVYVSNMGNFKDEHKNIIPIKIGNNGYVLIKTYYGFKLAHRLVMYTWKPIPNAEEMTVDHLNHNKRENTVYNLEWVTEEENKRRAVNDMLNPPKSKPKKQTLKTKTVYFTTVGEAVTWLQKTMNMPKETNLANVTKEVNKALKGNKTYCSRIWVKEANQIKATLIDN